MGQLDEATFDRLVSGLYSAATGAVDWSVPLREIQVAFGAWVAVLQTIDLASNGRLVNLQTGGDDPHIAEAALLFVREWHLQDPRRQRFLAMGPQAVGHWMHCDDVFDDAFVRRDPFFQQYLLGYGTRYNSAIALPITGHGVHDGITARTRPAHNRRAQLRRAPWGSCAGCSSCPRTRSEHGCAGIGRTSIAGSVSLPYVVD